FLCIAATICSSSYFPNIRVVFFLFLGLKDIRLCLMNDAMWLFSLPMPHLSFHPSPVCKSCHEKVCWFV
ncbi:hypothetical protein B296_00013147, partial [Ensete ventricosum]